MSASNANNARRATPASKAPGPPTSSRKQRHAAPALTKRAWFAAWAACVGLTACSGYGVQVDRDRREVRARIEGRRVHYRFGEVPSTWSPIAIDGNDAAWLDDATGGVAHVDHDCSRTNDTPLTALTQHLLIGFTDRQVVRQQTVPFDGREALHTELTARLDGVPVHLSLYVLKKDGCLYDLGYVAPPSTFAQGSPRFEAFAQGFATLAADDPEAYR